MQHEYADDYTTYSAERAAHARRWLAAERLVGALCAISAAFVPTQRLPTRESHAAHLASVAHFAAVVREHRANAARFGSPVHPISKSLARAMSARGVLVSEIEVAV